MPYRYDVTEVATLDGVASMVWAAVGFGFGVRAARGDLAELDDVVRTWLCVGVAVTDGLGTDVAEATALALGAGVMPSVGAGEGAEATVTSDEAALSPLGPPTTTATAPAPNATATVAAEVDLRTDDPRTPDAPMCTPSHRT